MYPGSFPGQPPGATPPATAASGSGGWGSLLAVLDDARRTPQPPEVACPNDGEPLTAGPDGRLFCRFDGYRPC